MCRLNLIYSADELKGLNKKSRGILQKEGIHLVRSSLAIQNIIAKDPKVRKKLKTMLRPTYKRLKPK